MTREAVLAYVPRECGIYLMLVPYNGYWFVRYVGKSTDMRARLMQHLARYNGAWVCWRYESYDAENLYEAECCEYRRYGGSAVLDNRRDPERPYASKRPPCSDLACPVPQRTYAARTY
jgi:hypothetical protein